MTSAGKLYGDAQYVEERHRHRFEVGSRGQPSLHLSKSILCEPAVLTHCSGSQVNPELKSHFEDKGFRFVGQDVEGERMEVIELDGKRPCVE